jgi:CBS domain-containing protein
MTRPPDSLAGALARPVREVMHQPIVACLPDTPLAQVARMMGIHRVHCVVVYRDDPDGSVRPWGVVSDLDALAAALTGEPGLTAADVGATPLLTVLPEDDVAAAARLMVEHAAAHVVVVGPTGGPLGILSTLDLARAIGHRPIAVAAAPADALTTLRRLRL